MRAQRSFHSFSFIILQNVFYWIFMQESFTASVCRNASAAEPFLLPVTSPTRPRLNDSTNEEPTSFHEDTTQNTASAWTASPSLSAPPAEPKRTVWRAKVLPLTGSPKKTKKGTNQWQINPRWLTHFTAVGNVPPSLTWRGSESGHSGAAV